MKTKPFNLEEALAGKPVVTRGGKEVTQFHLFDCDNLDPLYCVVQGVVYSYNRKGEYTGYYRHDLDLFMKVETKIIGAWINIYPTRTGRSYNTKNQADRVADYGRLECRKITWEVEV